MSESFVKSTIAVDPVKSALTKAELHKVRGQRREAIEVLQAALRERPDNEEITAKLKELQDMPGEPVQGEAKSGMGRVVLIVAAIAAAMFIFYAFVL